MKLTESQLRNIITKTIKESIFEQGVQQDAFNNLEQYIGNKEVELENKINIIQYKVELLNMVIPSLQEVDKELKSKFQGIQGPKMNKYRDWLLYTLPQPLQYNEETDSYGGYEGYIEEDIKEMFPQELRNFVSVYTNENEGAINQIEIIVDVDDIAKISNEE